MDPMLANAMRPLGWTNAPLPGDEARRWMRWEGVQAPPAPAPVVRPRSSRWRAFWRRGQAVPARRA